MIRLIRLAAGAGDEGRATSAGAGVGSSVSSSEDCCGDSSFSEDSLSEDDEGGGGGVAFFFLFTGADFLDFGGMVKFSNGVVMLAAQKSEDQ